MFQCMFPPSSKEYGFLCVFKIIHHFLLEENMDQEPEWHPGVGNLGRVLFYLYWEVLTQCSDTASLWLTESALHWPVCTEFPTNTARKTNKNKEVNDRGDCFITLGCDPGITENGLCVFLLMGIVLLKLRGSTNRNDFETAFLSTVCMMSYNDVSGKFF